MNIRKRDGRIVKFNEQKIINAILAAFKSVDGDVSDYAISKATNIASFIAGYYEEVEETPEVEDSSLYYIPVGGSGAGDRQSINFPLPYWFIWSLFPC